MNKSWLGGWYMPQETPYFAVHLTKGWYVFGIDCGLTDDIDTIQFQYFKNFVETELVQSG
jgi:hypothetical protein